MPTQSLHRTYTILRIYIHFSLSAHAADIHFLHNLQSTGLSASTKSDDTNARLGWVLLHVLVECHGLKDDLLMDTAGVEQMQSAVLAPDGKADVTDIETCLTGGNGDDVAIADVAEHFPAVPYPFLRDVAYGGSRYALLHLGYKTTLLHADLEQGIGVGVTAHIGKAEFHGDGDAAAWLYLANQTQLCPGLNPLAEVVIAAAVTVYLPFVVTQFPKPGEEVLPALTAVAGCERQSTDVLHERRTIEALEIDSQMLFLVLNLESVSHIRSPHELTGIEEGDALTVRPFAIHHFLSSKFQKLDNSETVLPRIAYRTLSTSRKDTSKRTDKQEYLHTIKLHNPITL